MDTSTNQLNPTGNPSAEASHTSAIFDIIARVKATARGKQRSVENLIESAQATQGKVLQRFNDHIDQLELEKVRLKKETESYKAAHDKMELQLEDARLEREALKQEKENQADGFEKVKKDFDQKLNALTQDNGQLSDRISTLEKDIKGHIQKNSELEQNNQAQRADIDKIKNEHSATLAKFESTKVELEREQQKLLAERGELVAKAGSLETEMGELRADSARKIAALSDELEHLRAKATDVENERKKAEVKLVKFQKAWDQLEG